MRSWTSRGGSTRGCPKISATGAWQHQRRPCLGLHRPSRSCTHFPEVSGSATRDGAARSGRFREFATPLGTVVVDSTCGGGVVQHGTMLTSVVGEAYPASPSGSGSKHKVHAKGGGASLKVPYLIGGEAQNEGATTAHTPAQVHAYVACCFGRQPRIGCEGISSCDLHLMTHHRPLPGRGRVTGLYFLPPPVSTSPRGNGGVSAAYLRREGRLRKTLKLILQLPICQGIVPVPLRVTYPLSDASARPRHDFYL